MQQVGSGEGRGTQILPLSWKVEWLFPIDPCLKKNQIKAVWQKKNGSEETIIKY